jgi:hypothetical protein
VGAKYIQEKTGWKATWGLVLAKDITLFLTNRYRKDSHMSTVSFTFIHRIEMALFWAFPIPVLIFAPALLGIPNILIWELSGLFMALFPLYKNILGGKKIPPVKPLFSFEKGGIQIIPLLLIADGFWLFHRISGILSWPALLKKLILALIIVVFLPSI